MRTQSSETSEILSMNIQWRKGFLTALREFKLTESSKTAEKLKPVLTELSQLKEQLPPSDRPVIEVMEYLVNGFINLCNWVQASLSGEPEQRMRLTGNPSPYTTKQTNVL